MIWDPFDEISRMYEEMDRVFNKSFRQRTPLIGSGKKSRSLKRYNDFRMPLADIKETEKNVLATVEIPGAEKDDIELNVTEDRIEVKVEKKDESEVKEKDSYSYKKTSSQYYRALPLPAEVDSSKAKASYKNGVLKVEIPKIEKIEDKKKRIQIE